jgi:hypothetical protein
VRKGSAVPITLAAIWAVVIFGALVLTFVVIGSPAKARREHADQIREDALSSIAQGVRQAATSGKDVNELSQLESTVGGFYDIDLNDPVTGQPYGYKRIDHLHFQLCATFETDTMDKPKGETSFSYYSGGDFYRHKKGLVCFTLDVR